MQGDRVRQAIDLMAEFARRTGLSTADRPSTDRPFARRPRRYLWTDAFAVCNFLALRGATGDRRYHADALRLVDQVHHELGRYRTDDIRRGWISGVDEADGQAHPTRGGLRIGKPLPERAPAEPLDPDAEWDRDGQYFHYLTKWSHALDQVARSTREARFHGWARELMDAAHRAFSLGPAGHKRMVWKMSTDLSRPLVSSMGQHDPLDGFVTCAQLEATARLFDFPARPALDDAIEDFVQMLHPAALATADPLGLGGLLVDASRLVQIEPTNCDLAAQLFAAARSGLDRYLQTGSLRAPPHRRLAFRELGLAIGLEAVSLLENDVWMDRLDAHGRKRFAEVAAHLPLRDRIVSFWVLPEHRGASSWIEHADINDVMLATCLVPEGFIAPLRLATRASSLVNS